VWVVHYGIFFFDTIENLIEFYIFYCKINLFYMSFISLDFLGPIEPKIQMSTNMKFKYLVQWFMTYIHQIY